jgi:hypothetical protein
LIIVGQAVPHVREPVAVEQNILVFRSYSTAGSMPASSPESFTSPNAASELAAAAARQRGDS